jgi:hypothetical protein
VKVLELLGVPVVTCRMRRLCVQSHGPCLPEATARVQCPILGAESHPLA